MYLPICGDPDCQSLRKVAELEAEVAKLRAVIEGDVRSQKRSVNPPNTSTARPPRPGGTMPRR